MGDEHSEQNKPLWRQQARTTPGLLAGMFIARCIPNWHAFRDHGLMAGFKAFRWDDFLPQAFGATSLAICFALLGQRKVITTLGIGEATAKKLR
jgi:hypothetical protein